jgi:UDP-N-acetylmuramoylalanine--D-glutamate ligase
LKEYVLAKRKLFNNQADNDIAIVSDDDVLCKELADQMEKKPLLFGHRRDCDAYICESEIYLKHMGRIEVYNLSGSVFDNAIGKLNCAPAIIAARNCGCSKEDIMRGLNSFSPLPHRMEYVDSINDVAYCNDSKATNTGAVIRALQQSKGRVVLIAGGRDKGEEYQLLRDAARNKVRALVLIGEAAGAIASQLQDLAEIHFAGSMEEAVFTAAGLARTGDTVLLSPACASFDMFDSYAHRGQLFRESVIRLKQKMSAPEAG